MMKTEQELMEDYRTYLTNCLEDEHFDLDTLEDWYTWKAEELERLSEYNAEDLQLDVDWLIGQGVDESEAEPFIIRLLKQHPGAGLL